MNYTIVTAKIDPQTKREARETAEALGLSLSAVIKSLLKQFIRTKQLSVNLEEKPTKYLLRSLKKSEEDYKTGRVSPRFTNAKDATAWLNDPNAFYANGDTVRDEV